MHTNEKCVKTKKVPDLIDRQWSHFTPSALMMIHYFQWSHGWLKQYTKLKEWQANSCAFEESTPKMKSKGRRKAKWTASVCGKTEGLFIKYWSCNQWTIPHTYHTYHTTPAIVLTYKNMPTKIRDSLPIINPDLFVSYVKICCPVQFWFVISRKVPSVSIAKNKKNPLSSWRFVKVTFS